MRVSLRNKFILSFFFVGIIPLILMGFVSAYLINLANRYNIASLETSLLIQKSNEIESFFNEIMEGMRIQVGTETPWITLVDQEFLLSGILETIPAIEEAAFLAVVPYLSPDPNALKDESIEGDMKSGKKFKIGQETRKFSRHREIIQEDVNSEDLLKKGELNEFKIARTGKDYISGVHWTLSGPMTRIALPVKNKTGDIISVISAEINLTNIQKNIIGKARIGSSGYVFVVDSQGLILAHSGQTAFIHKDLSSAPVVKAISRGSLINPLDKEGNYQSYFGESVIASAGFLPKLGWGVVVEWPEEDASAAVRDISRQVVIFAVLAFFIVIFLGLFMAKRIINPLSQLRRGAKKISEGEFDYRIDIKTRDELEELGQEFNLMAKGLKRLQELRNEFVFVAAHELRTPVTAIKGYISMLLEGDAGVLPDEAQRYLSQTNKANERLVGLVNDLLEIARSEAGRLEVKVIPQDIIENVGIVITELKMLAREKNIEVIYQPQEKIPKVLADSDRLKEVLINVIGNAIKYNKEGGKIKIMHEVKGKSVITRVKDTGFGMTPEELSHLFEKFWRSKDKEVRSQTGTGLGLFIVKELVTRMNGKIWAASEKGAGSTFSFSLPIAK